MENRKFVSALDMSTDNIYYVRYIQKINKSKVKLIERTDSQDVYSSEFNFLSYMTKKYFKDNILCSFIKFLLGIFSIVVLVILTRIFPKGNVVKSILMVLMLGYGIIMIPLSILYIIANTFCFFRYKEYMTTKTSVLSKKIIHFYAEGTDKLAAVNWKTIFLRDAANYHEEKRMRGW